MLHFGGFPPGIQDFPQNSRIFSQNVSFLPKMSKFPSGLGITMLLSQKGKP